MATFFACIVFSFLCPLLRLSPSCLYSGTKLTNFLCKEDALCNVFLCRFHKGQICGALPGLQRMANFGEVFLLAQMGLLAHCASLWYRVAVDGLHFSNVAIVVLQWPCHKHIFLQLWLFIIRVRHINLLHCCHHSELRILVDGLHSVMWPLLTCTPSMFVGAEPLLHRSLDFCHCCSHALGRFF